MNEFPVDCLGSFRLYAGDGTTAQSRGMPVADFSQPATLDDPRHYLAPQALRDAVNVALALGQPLLVTGEPGTGKTQLAASLAFELGLPAPFVFNTKTTSTARDLFYRYDSLRHFHDAQFRREKTDASDYVTYEALGLAMLLSLPPEAGDPHLPPALRGKGPARSVVLIDEIDKAPRDLPNDILNEIEGMSFHVPETNQSFRADTALRPIVILTSNSEKHLPDAFMRRCIFYHIAFPPLDSLREIVFRRSPPATLAAAQRLDHALTLFESLRELRLRKKPATAECLQWLQIIERMKIDTSRLEPGQAEALALSYCVLAKNREDLELMQQSTLKRGK